ncbi:hypothetical protein GF366_03995 [Candidatus Peregrinibacteria bacterium]|nr:hypothetical protein [Candidatus Peregrinibacteria bacterium]
MGRSFFSEIVRKTFHLSSLLIVVGYTLALTYFSDRIAILTITGLLLLFLEIEYIRIEHKPKFAEIFDRFFREHEKYNLSGSIFLVIACIICFAAFDYWIAVLALFMTVFGDLFSALIGRAFGKAKLYKNKTYIGTFAGLAANLITGLLLLSGFISIVAPMAFIATFTEVLTNKIDDNLTVPLFSGFVGQMLVFFFSLDLPDINFLDLFM